MLFPELLFNVYFSEVLTSPVSVSLFKGKLFLLRLLGNASTCEYQIERPLCVQLALR